MKRALLIIAAVALVLATAAVSSAMWGMRGSYTQEEQKFLEETSELRKDLHAKKFEFREALRKGEYQKAENLEKEIEAAEAKLEEKAGKAGVKTGRGHKGHGMGPYAEHRGGRHMMMGGCGGSGCAGPCGQ